MAFILNTCKNHVRKIKLNRPERKNAFNQHMYMDIANTLNKDAVNDDIAVTIITGTGEYFSSGNDLQNAMENSGDIEGGLKIFKGMVDAFINYPKILISVVNGPAIGIGATMPALCDIIYASNTAFFDTPFIKLGLSIEGASSFSFPQNLGKSKASEMIFLNHRLSAQEAYNFGFISEIVPHYEIEQFIENLHQHGNLSVKGIIANKKLLMANYKNSLSESSTREVNELYNSITSSNYMEQVMAFLNRKKKL